MWRQRKQYHCRPERRPGLEYQPQARGGTKGRGVAGGGDRRVMIVSRGRCVRAVAVGQTGEPADESRLRRYENGRQDAYYHSRQRPAGCLAEGAQGLH